MRLERHFQQCLQSHEDTGMGKQSIVRAALEQVSQPLHAAIATGSHAAFQYERWKDLIAASPDPRRPSGTLSWWLD